MSATDKFHAALLDDLAALGLRQRRELAKELRGVVETFSWGARRSAHRSCTWAVGALPRSG